MQKNSLIIIFDGRVLVVLESAAVVKEQREEEEPNEQGMMTAMEKLCFLCSDVLAAAGNESSIRN